FFARPRRPPGSPPFPYTTLFRSLGPHHRLTQPGGLLAHRRRDTRTLGRPATRRRHPMGPHRESSGKVRVLGTEGHSSGNIMDLRDRKSTRLNSSHVKISYAVFCL